MRGPDQAGWGEPLAAQVSFGDAYRGTMASDHYGVIATIEFGH